MTGIRETGWFIVLAIVMAGWMGLLGSFRGEAVAGVIASRGAGAEEPRAADTAKLQAFLESRIVLQKLVDYGVSPEDAKARILAMSDSDLHRLASLTDKVGDGGDGVGIAISLAVLVILVLLILMLMNKRVVVR